MEFQCIFCNSNTSIN